MNCLLPANDVALRRGVVSEKRFESLRPGKRAAFYIPIPNCIVCSPGNNRKIVIARWRMTFKYEMCGCVCVFMGDLFKMGCDDPIERRRLERRFCSLFPFVQSHASSQTKLLFLKLVPCL